MGIAFERTCACGVLHGKGRKRKLHFFAQLFDAACPVQAATKCLGGNVFHDASHTFCFDSMSALPPRIKRRRKRKGRRRRKRRKTRFGRRGSGLLI